MVDVFILFFTLLLLSLDAHNHVDDYSGTLGGVRKKSTFQLWSQVLKIKLLHCLKKQNKNKLPFQVHCWRSSQW